ncbi:MAG: carbohydrate ABC transporter permease [Chloroflexi bacterium]|nr:carbohydrate ABC transporter permease [Chloroflexota bacterium]
MFLPFLWLISTSLKGPFEAYIFPPEWIPNPPHWENYPEVLTKLPFGLYVRNTLTITLAALVGQVVTASMCAYAFARLRFPGRDAIFGIKLATMMLPSAVTLIPVYILFKELRWINTFLPLTVPFWFGGGAFYIFLLRQFFLTIPMELEEAAIIDGASPFTIFTRIMVPLSRPAITVVTIFGFLQHWNDFLGPLIYLNTADKRTIAIGLAVMTAGLEWGRDMTHLVMAVSVIMIMPIIVIFFFAQRAFIQGVVLTGIKG